MTSIMEMLVRESEKEGGTRSRARSVPVLARSYAIIGVAAATVVAVGAGLWVAVGAGGSDEPPRAPDLSAEAELWRADETRQIMIVLTNHDPVPVFVASVQLVSPDFERVPGSRHDRELPTGGVARVPLEAKYGAGRCDGQVRTMARPALARVWVRSAAGKTDAFTVPLADPYKYLDTLLRQDCEREKIDSTVKLAYSGSWERARTASGDEAVRIGLRIRLIDPAATVDLTEVTGSVIFNVDPAVPDDSRPHVDASAPRTEPPLEFTNNRCDLHAVAESKTTFIFRFYFSIDGGQPISRALVPDDTGVDALRALINRGCHLGGQ